MNEMLDKNRISWTVDLKTGRLIWNISEYSNEERKGILKKIKMWEARAQLVATSDLIEMMTGQPLVETAYHWNKLTQKQIYDIEGTYEDIMNQLTDKELRLDEIARLESRKCLSHGKVEDEVEVISTLKFSELDNGKIMVCQSSYIDGNGKVKFGDH